MPSLSPVPAFRDAVELAHALFVGKPDLQSHLDADGTVEVGGWRFRLRKEPCARNIDVEILRPRSLLRCIWFLFSRRACKATRDAIRSSITLSRDERLSWCASSPVMHLAATGDWRGREIREAALFFPSFKQADLRGVKLEGVVLHRAIFREVDMREAELNRLELLAWCDFRGVDLSHAIITLSEDYGAPLRRCAGLRQQDIDDSYQTVVIGLLSTLDTIENPVARHGVAIQFAERLLAHAMTIREAVSPLALSDIWHGLQAFASQDPGAFGDKGAALLNALRPPDLLDVQGGIEMTPRAAFAILNLQPPFTEQRIQSAYRLLALKEHSDKGGDDRRMTMVNAARDVALSALSARLPVTASFQSPSTSS
ncbi:pentapeptide repeat-containing protein [Cupriavidus sp. AU9028]|uniref:pentapeptide repeat-containing protein n=1 Tax=Cupriavidus sp. AU9028 TaxID=2871157 RepID=UPI001C973F46|nr:pentapeptide repeat-containing protein [Cupriavidus sp. AU9028]MBY4897419.1 pentapeptide repeat-containing protein [Cupriavidus sp. AU9028]